MDWTLNTIQFMDKPIYKVFLLTVLLLGGFNKLFSTETAFKISVTTNHADWLYKINEKVKFIINITKDNNPVGDIKIDIEIGQEKMTPQIKKSIFIKNGTFEIDGGTMSMPGFLRCTVKTEYENINYEALATAAFEPERITPTTTAPEDFTKFWENAIQENAKIPIDIKSRILEDKCTDKVNVYEVNIQNFKVGMRLYGILCIPTVPGKHPAILEVPGAGVRPYKGDMDMAAKGIITFQIGIHGIPVTLDSIVYANLKYGALLDYPTFNLDNKDNYYYKHVYLGCVKAIDFIFTLPEFDGYNLGVYGGSQGGALSIVTAALDKRVIVLACLFPALCDLTGSLNGRADGWPHFFTKPENVSKEKIETSKYYDVVNFAKTLKIPGFYSFGYNDVVCPPTSVYSAYNSIEAPKTIFIVKETGHTPVPEQNMKANEFLFEKLSSK